MKLDKITAKGSQNLYRSPQSGVIYFRQYKTGIGQFYKSTRTSNLMDAKKIADEFRLSFLKKEALASFPKSALELFDQWVDRKRSANKSENTITSILASRRNLKEYLEVLAPVNLTALWWECVYIPQTRAKLGQARKFFNDRKWLLSFLRQMKDDGVIKACPKLINPDPPWAAGKVFTDEEIGLLINFSSDYLRLAILMAATMGMRRGEIFGLRWDRVDLTKRVISLRKDDTKIRRARSFAISDAVFDELAVKESNSPADYVFPHKTLPGRPMDKDGFRTAWDTLKSNFDIDGRFHDLRHTFLTKAFKAPGGNPALICHYAGLSLEVAVRTYLHFNEDDSRKVSGLVSYE